MLAPYVLLNSFSWALIYLVCSNTIFDNWGQAADDLLPVYRELIQAGLWSSGRSKYIQASYWLARNNN